MSRHALSWLPPSGEFTLRDAYRSVGVEQTVSDRRSAHLALAVALQEVDRSEMNEAAKQDALKGIIQAWQFFAAQEGEYVEIKTTRTFTDVQVEPTDQGFESAWEEV